MTTLTIVFGILAIALLGAGLTAAARHDTRILWRGGAIGLSAVYAFFAAGHFVDPVPLSMMLPVGSGPGIVITLLTGVLWAAISLGFFFERTARAAGWASIVALIAYVPIQVYSAMFPVMMSGAPWGVGTLETRLPMTALLIVWAVVFTIWHRNIDMPQMKSPKRGAMHHA